MTDPTSNALRAAEATERPLGTLLNIGMLIMNGVPQGLAARISDQYETACRDLASSRSRIAELEAENARLRETLCRVESGLESIRLILIDNLAEPERAAFWEAVRLRNEVRAALSKGEG